jgi:heat shock protein HslJ
MTAIGRRVLFSVLACVALAAGACTDDSSSEPSPTSTTPTPTSITPSQVVGTWVLREISPAPGVMPSGELALDMRADGTFLADTGCNAQLGKWRVSADGLTFYETMISAKLCLDRPDVLAWFVRARLSSDGKELRVEDNASAATYTRR